MWSGGGVTKMMNRDPLLGSGCKHGRGRHRARFGALRTSSAKGLCLRVVGLAVQTIIAIDILLFAHTIKLTTPTPWEAPWSAQRGTGRALRRRELGSYGYAVAPNWAPNRAF